MINSYYSVIHVTNQPSFYKVKQWNEIAKHKKVLLIFMREIEKDRNKDFVSEKPYFDHITLPQNRFVSFWMLFWIILESHYSELILGGWYCLHLLLLPFISKKKKNSFLCESSIYEYRSSKFRDFIKRLFLHRISKVYVSGIAQKKIFDYLGYDGMVVFTGGCGLLNYIPQPPYSPRGKVRNFLYVGRLVEQKNLKLLINVFNSRPDLNLQIIGFGEQEQELKTMAKPNICFLGAVDNSKLSSYYQSADVFVLPSKIEPWGLVVEEALNNGTPVIVSDKVGCHDDLVSFETGLVFESVDENGLYEAIEKMLDVSYYNSLRKSISKLNFLERGKRQIDIFI